jgi:hypothetical protein
MASVAVTGEVVATPSPITSLGGAPGSWAAGTVVDTGYASMTIDGRPVIHQARCAFTFTNANTGATTVANITLAASATPLQRGRSGVLRQGDVMVDAFGNSLAVRITRPAKLTS